MQPHVSRRERAGSSLPRSFGRGCCRRRRKQCRVGARRTRAHAGLMEMTYRRCEADGYLDGRNSPLPKNMSEAPSYSSYSTPPPLVHESMPQSPRSRNSRPPRRQRKDVKQIFTSGSRNHERASIDDEQPEYCIKPCSTRRANSQPEGHQARPTSTNMTSASREPTPN